MSIDTPGTIMAATQLQTNLQESAGGIITGIVLAAVVMFVWKGFKWALGVLIGLSVLTALVYNVDLLAPLGNKIWQAFIGLLP